MKKLPLTIGRADELIDSLPLEECERLYKALRYRWSLWERPRQRLPESGWDIANLVAGRGGGKTRPGAEWTNAKAKRFPGCRIALVSRTARDVRDTMIEGESGLIACSPPWFRPEYQASKSRVVYPNGSMAFMYSSQKADLLRGPQHHFGWGDEYASWLYIDTYSNLLDGLRLGKEPQAVFTTTPRRLKWFLDAVLGQKDENGRRPVSKEQLASGSWLYDQRFVDQYGREITFRTIGRKWSTEENSLNLAPGFAAKRRMAYGDSSYGRQELDGELLDIVEGALWSLDEIDAGRVQQSPEHYRRIVVVDPSHAEDGRRDACGIIVLGAGPPPEGKASQLAHAYVLADRSRHGSPLEWGQAAVRAHDEFRCDCIAYESNETPTRPNLVKSVIGSVDTRHRIKWVPIPASRDKRTRAEPAAALYSTGRVHHVEAEGQTNHLAALEEEMVSWDPWDPHAKSPNRVDALVHGVTLLLIQNPRSGMPISAPVSIGERPQSRM